jgi:hypothetical protein
MYTVDDLWNLHERPLSLRQRAKSLVICIPGWPIVRVNFEGVPCSDGVCSHPPSEFRAKSTLAGPTATITSFLLLLPSFAQEEQSCNPELKRTQPILAGMAIWLNSIPRGDLRQQARFLTHQVTLVDVVQWVDKDQNLACDVWSSSSIS